MITFRVRQLVVQNVTKVQALTLVTLLKNCKQVPAPFGISYIIECSTEEADACWKEMDKLYSLTAGGLKRKYGELADRIETAMGKKTAPRSPKAKKEPAPKVVKVKSAPKLPNGHRSRKSMKEQLAEQHDVAMITAATVKLPDTRNAYPDKGGFHYMRLKTGKQVRVQVMITKEGWWGWLSGYGGQEFKQSDFEPNKFLSC